MNRAISYMILGLMIVSAATGQVKQPGELLSAAQYEEEVTGDLQEAIKTYNVIIDEYPDEEQIAARALLRLGLCYEKLGNAEAVKAYERILERYAGQRDQVVAAQARLRQLKQRGNEGFLVEKLDFHIPEPFDISPDGTKILGVAFDMGQNIVVSHLNQDKIDYITTFEWDDEYYWTYNPVWSPDGKEIAYNACFEESTGSSIHSLRISDLAGQTRELIRSETDWFVPNGWMPDGSSILCIKQDRNLSQKLGLVDVSGGTFRELVSLSGQITTSGSSRAASCYSPDGRFIAYTDHTPGGDMEIFVVSTSGGEAWSVAGHPANEKWPRWSPDGRNIVFLSNRHGSMALWGIAVDQGKQAGKPFLIREGMGNNILGNWTGSGLVSWNWVRILDIYMLGLDPVTHAPTGESALLAITPSGNNSSATFSPQNNQIAFIRNERDLEKRSLIIARPDGSQRREYEFPEGFSFSELKWLPDGSGIGTIGADEKNEKSMLIFHLGREAWEIVHVEMGSEWYSFDWTGNGRAFIYGMHGLAGENAGIIEHDLESGKQRYVYQPDDTNRTIFRGLKSSNDFSKVAFLEGNSRLISLDLKSLESQLIHEGTWLLPSWSPDGKSIITIGAENPDSEDSKLYFFPLSGAQPEIYEISGLLPEDCTISGFQPSTDYRTLMVNLDHGISEQVLYKNIIPDQ